MHIERVKIYKFINHMVKILGFCPLLIIVSKITGQYYGPKYFMTHCVLGLSIGTIVYMQMLIKNLIQNKMDKTVELLQKIFIACGYIIVTSISIVLLQRFIMGSLQYEILAWLYYAFLFGMVVNDFQKEYFNIISMEQMVVCTVIYTLAICFMKEGGLGIIYILFFGAYIFTKNQRRIEFLLEQTKENTPMAKKIKRDNIIWVCILMSCILIVYPLRERIGKFISWIFTCVIYGVWTIIKGIIDFINGILGVGEVEVARQANIQKFAPGVTAQGEDLWDKIIYSLLIMIMVYIVIKKRQQIKNYFIKLIMRFKEMLSEAIYRLFGRDRNKKLSISNKYYVETIENINDEMLQKVKKPKKIAKHKWKRQVKQYLKQLSGTSNYRKGYQLVLQGARLKGIKINSSRTPREILEMMNKELEVEHLVEGTHIYEKVRYDDQMTKKEEIEIIASILQQLLA